LTVQQALIAIFQQWGLPKWIKVDNGRPFGDPKTDTIPLLALWVIGLGMDIIWNRPRTPQDNAKVERCQGVLNSWVEPLKCKDTVEFQNRLAQEAHFYNYDFPIRSFGGLKRIERFPTLAHTGREYKPEAFSLQRVLDFVAKGKWQRKVSTNGQINIWGQRFSLGVKFKHQVLDIKLCPKNNQWIIFDHKGDVIKTETTRITENTIKKLDWSK